MLYPHNREEKPDQELFRNPGAEYRCTPFWAWNCDLDEDLLKREIGYMQQMGMGGFHMHTRSGMSIPYLSDAFMAVRICRRICDGKRGKPSAVSASDTPGPR